MNRIERVADLVGDAGGQQCQGVAPFRLDGLLGLMAGLCGIVQDEGEARLGILVDRGGKHPEESGLGESDLDLSSQRVAGVDRVVEVPFEFRQEAFQGLSKGVLGRVPDQASGGLIEEHDLTLTVGDHDAVLDRLEQGLEKGALGLEAFHQRLEPLPVEPVQPGQDLIEEPRLRAGLPRHSHFLRQKYSTVRSVDTTVRMMA